MTLSDLAIKRPVFAWMIMASLIIFGGVTFVRMGVSQLPDVDFPVVSIYLDLPGAAPEVMESDVIEQIEDSLTSISGILSISSASRSGSGSVTVEFDLKKDIDVAVQEVQTALARAQSKLPLGMEPPVVAKSNPEDQPILWITVASDKLPEKELNSLVRDRIRDRFTTVPGVGEVFLGGYNEPNLRLWVSAPALRRYSLAVSDVVSAVKAEHVELPSGRIEAPLKEWNVRTLGEAASPEAFARLPITRRGGTPNFARVTVGDVARVEEGTDDIRRRSRLMDKPAVGLGIKKQRGVNTVDVANAAKKRMKEIAAQLPPGVEISVAFDSSEFIEQSIHELNFTLAMAALLTAIVCWLFLGSWSATLNVILAIPTSVVGSFIILYAAGFTLNVFTLLGLSLAIGIVVDDAIMVLENIVRHHEMGKDRVRASGDGAREITFAAMAATIAVIAIFLPVAFVPGIIGRYLFQFGVTLSVAVGLSLLEALTLTPMRCSQFLSAGDRQTRLGKLADHTFDRLARWYRNGLHVVLKHRFATVVGAVLFCALAYTLAGKLPKEFMPAQDQSRLLLRMQTPIGSSLAFTDGKVKELGQILRKRPDIERYFGSVGGFGGGDVNTAILFLTLKAKKERPINPKTGRRPSQQDVASELRAQLKGMKDLRVVVQDLSQAGIGRGRGFPVEMTVRGPEWDTLIASTKRLMARMEESKVLADVDTNYLSGQPEVQIIPNREQAFARGVSVTDINETVRALIGGTLVGKYAKGGHRYDIRLRLEPEQRSASDDIRKLTVRNNRGELIPLSELITLKETTGLQAIYRQDRERAITVYANLAPGASQAAALETVTALAKETLPEGYRAVPGGSSQTFQESFRGILIAILLGIIVAYMVLASQFNSFLDPVTVLVALPFSIAGAFVALKVGGYSINLFSLIGLVLLMGIVKKNSILLVDFTNQRRADGLETRQALLDACPVRLRPILMTSFATIAGALPAALALGPGSEVQAPMATAVIGGVLFSTVLTLFVVPSVYSLFASLRQRLKRTATVSVPVGAEPA